VSEDELDVFASAEIREPVPGEHALDADDEVITERFDGSQEYIRPALHVLVQEDLSVSVQNAEVHGLGMKIDAAVMLVVLGVESHGSLLEWLVFCFQPTYSEWGRSRRGLNEDQSDEVGR
jgi:hypothetical protein